MNRTMVVGGILFSIGFVTQTKFSTPKFYNHVGSKFGTVAIIMGLFLIWNGYVSDYNREPSFAMLG